MTNRLAADGAEIVQRDVAAGLPFVDAACVAANFGEGDPAGRALSDALVDELLSVDGLILVPPIYNFSIPAALKAWIDRVVRLGRTFDITDSGPVGLATNVRQAWLVTASSSTEIGGKADHATPCLRHILATIGVPDVTIVGAGEWQTRGPAVIEDAHQFVDAASAGVSGRPR